MNTKAYLMRCIAALLVSTTFAGCGSNLFSSSKYLQDPFSLRGTATEWTCAVRTNGLTTRLAAEWTDTFARGNSSGGDGLAPYKDMRKIELNQRLEVVLGISSNQPLPAEIVLRNVDVRVTIRATDTLGQASRSSPPVEVRFAGTMTLSRQADNTYVAHGPLSSTTEYLNPQAENLLSVLVDGSENNIEIAATFTADTGTTSIPSGSEVVIKLRFDGGTAVIRW